MKLILLKQIGCTESDEHPYTENIPLQYYPLVNGDSNNTLFTISHDTNLSLSWTSSIIARAIGYLSSSLSVNGSRLAFDASKFNISQTAMENGILTQVINFRYNFSDEGIYFHSLYFPDLYNLLRMGCEFNILFFQYLDYYDYIDTYLQILHINQISFIIFPFILTTYSE